jgi:hypothetical protein
MAGSNRPELAGATEGQEVIRTVASHARPCARKAADAAARWIAGDRPALRTVSEFHLCASCLDAFRLFLAEFRRNEKPGRGCEARPGESETSWPIVQ